MIGIDELLAKASAQLTESCAAVTWASELDRRLVVYAMAGFACDMMQAQLEDQLRVNDAGARTA